MLTAGAALADAQRSIDKAAAFRRKAVQPELKLAMEFCRLLIELVSPTTSGFAENYCRRHVSVATQLMRHVLAAHDPHSPESKQLIRIAAVIEENLKANLDEETAKLCWLGDEGDTIVRELERHSVG